MSMIATKDGTQIYFKDWGQPIVFSHDWPLSADDWDAQMMFFLNRGYRVIAHDRRFVPRPQICFVKSLVRLPSSLPC
jgi:non-heme chloroperoxidase